MTTLGWVDDSIGRLGKRGVGTRLEIGPYLETRMPSGIGSTSSWILLEVLEYPTVFKMGMVTRGLEVQIPYVPPVASSEVGNVKLLLW